ncbi:MAG TPA: flagellar motor protein MotA, partial [Bryobacteraceae bacterium]|nr:flagellar motor protein MotA [Bryobacteraceae bacterium]
MPYVGALIQMSIWELVLGASLLSKIVLLILFVASVLSWTMILAKWSQFRSGVDANAAFLRAFRKAPNLESVAVVAEQFRNAPVTVVFDFCYQEVARQARTK